MLTKYSNECLMPLDKFVEDLVSDLLNLIVVSLLDQPVQHVPLYPEVAGVDVGDVVEVAGVVAVVVDEVVVEAIVEVVVCCTVVVEKFGSKHWHAVQN